MLMPREAKARAFRVLVCCGHDWWPYSRVLWALHRAGFETHLIAPQGSIAASSRFRDQLVAFGPEQELQSLIRARLHAERYDWVYVGDEPSLAALAPYRREPWARPLYPIRPDHAQFDVLLNKHAFSSLLEQLDVPVAPGRLAHDEAEARDIARALGFPLAVKLGWGQGGAGVFRAQNEGELSAALGRVRADYPVRLEAWSAGLAGGTQALFAHGELVAWTSSIQESIWPEPAGPSCVRRVLHHPLIEPSLRRFGAATGYHGLCGPDWIVTPEGELWFLELNPRGVSSIHHDRFDDVDFGRAFVSFAGGAPYSQPAPATGALGRRIHMFPQHLLYCLASRNYREIVRGPPFSGTSDILWRDPGPLYRGLWLIAEQCARLALARLARCAAPR